MAAELGTKDKKKRRKKANKPSNSNLALLLYKDKITKPPHTVCVHLGKGERCRKGGRYRQGGYTPIVWQSARFKVKARIKHILLS